MGFSNSNLFFLIPKTTHIGVSFSLSRPIRERGGDKGFTSVAVHKDFTGVGGKERGDYNDGIIGDERKAEVGRKKKKKEGEEEDRLPDPGGMLCNRQSKHV